MEDIIEEIKEDILPYCTNFSSNNFMGFPDAGNSIAGISGALLTDFLQQNLINSSFCAPIGTYIEIALIQWLRRIVGYRNKKNIKNVVLAYSGGLDTSIIIPWLKENYGCAVICCAADEASVYAALQKALSPAFAAQARQAKSPYNGGDTSARIVKILETFDFSRPKVFYDGPGTGSGRA